MKKKIRLFLSVIILVVSIAFLIWGFLPVKRETRIEQISPTEMTLPTPQSSLGLQRLLSLDDLPLDIPKSGDFGSRSTYES
jgi:hypothetical protein